MCPARSCTATAGLPLEKGVGSLDEMLAARRLPLAARCSWAASFCSLDRSIKSSLLGYDTLNASEQRQPIILSLASSLQLQQPHIFTDKLHAYLNSANQSLHLSMRLREDVLIMMKSNKKKNINDERIHVLDDILKKWLHTFLASDAIQLKRVTFEESSGEMLEKVAKGDLVYPVKRMRDLKLRVRLNNGKRCFVIHHANFPNDPLAFLHFALSQKLEGSIPSLYATEEDLKEPTHAIFYSVSSPHASLTGLDMAAKIIKFAVKHIQSHHPSVTTFSTLSPIPGFAAWLDRVVKQKSYENIKWSSTVTQEFVRQHSEIIGNSPQKNEIVEFVHRAMKGIASVDDIRRMQGVLTSLIGHYLVNEKIKDSGTLVPLDPVARFHLRNGAELHRVNFLGNASKEAIGASAGFMVNYLYDLSKLDERNETFIKTGKFSVHDQVLSGIV